MQQRWSLFLVILVGLSACQHGAVYVPLRAPNPNGCYVTLFAKPRFAGEADLVNGPLRWATLDRLSQTNSESWNNRIRSLRVGRAATLKAYTKPQFAGDARQFGAGTAHASLDRFSGHIQSLELTCDRP
jgi:hypothetical protein